MKKQRIKFLTRYKFTAFKNQIRFSNEIFLKF